MISFSVFFFYKAKQARFFFFKDHLKSGNINLEITTFITCTYLATYLA